MYLWALGRLKEVGYEQYEISNVARRGEYSRHNLKYWTDGEWLGFGCGAHSTRAGVRWKNVGGTEDYVARIRRGEDPVGERHVLTATERLGDALFTGLRLNDGVDLAAVGSRYGVDVRQRYGPALVPFVEAGLLVGEEDRLQLTPPGDAAGQRDHECFRLAPWYGRLPGLAEGSVLYQEGGSECARFSICLLGPLG